MLVIALLVLLVAAVCGMVYWHAELSAERDEHAIALSDLRVANAAGRQSRIRANIAEALVYQMPDTALADRILDAASHDLNIAAGWAVSKVRRQMLATTRDTVRAAQRVLVQPASEATPNEGTDG